MVLMGFEKIEINLVWYIGNSKAEENTFLLLCMPFSNLPMPLNPIPYRWGEEPKTLSKVKVFPS